MHDWVAVTALCVLVLSTLRLHIRHCSSGLGNRDVLGSKHNLPTPQPAIMRQPSLPGCLQMHLLQQNDLLYLQYRLEFRDNLGITT